MVAPDDRAAIATALRSCGQADPLQARIVRIKNTLSLGTIDVSESLARQIKPGGTVRPTSPYFSLSFDAEDRLVPFEQALQVTLRDFP
jgi:hypothetical protein